MEEIGSVDSRGDGSSMMNKIKKEGGIAYEKNEHG